MFWLYFALGAIIWIWIGIEIVVRIDRYLIKSGDNPLDSEKRGDRVTFRVAVLLWPLTLGLFGTFAMIEYREHHPGTGRVKSWFESGGITHRYMEWRQRR